MKQKLFIHLQLNVNVVLKLRQYEERNNSGQDSDILEQKNQHGVLDPDLGHLVHRGVHLRHHVDERDVEKHSSGGREDVLVAHVHLANHDTEEESEIAGAGRQEVVDHRLSDCHTGI